ncbi:hypothetical protein N9961_01920 [bacterium]|nr:hypothetical protein [bacterium]
MLPLRDPPEENGAGGSSQTIRDKSGQEARSFKMTEPTKILKIRPPAAIHLFFGHNQGVQQERGEEQVKSVQKNSFI